MNHVLNATLLKYYDKLDVGQRFYVQNLTEATYDVGKIKTHDFGSLVSGILAYSLVSLCDDIPELTAIGSVLVPIISFNAYFTGKSIFVINGWIKNCGDGRLLNGVPVSGCENVTEEMYYAVMLLKWRKEPPWSWEEPYCYNVPVLYVECR